MKKTLDFNDFEREFNNCGRENQFSHDGLKALFDFLEEVSPDSELDVIAICCEFSEYGIFEALQYYNLDTLQQIEEKTLVLKVDADTIIIQDF